MASPEKLETLNKDNTASTHLDNHIGGLEEPAMRSNDAFEPDDEVANMPEITPSKEACDTDTEVIDMPNSSEIQMNTQAFQVKEAYVHKAADITTTTSVETAEEKDKGVFGVIAEGFWNIFRWRRRWGTPRVSPETGSKFLNPATNDSRLSKRKTSNIADDSSFMLETIKGGKHYELDRTNSLESSRFDESTQISECPRRTDSIESEKQANYISYEADIYSVNAAGKPVPITIEETRNDDPLYCTSSSEESFDEPAENDGSKVRLHPTKKNRKFTEVAIAVWKKTYKPDCVFMYYWLMLVTLCVLYNIWIIPLRAGFADVQATWQNVWFAIDVICDVIYIVDIFIKFRTRFTKEGVYIKTRRQLNRNHRKEWTLVLDFLAIFPTDLFFIESINPYYRLNRILKIYRAYVYFRMVELKTRWPNALRSINLAHAILIIIHYNACIYHAASLQNGYGSTLSSWPYPDPSLYPDYATLTRRYTYSFYWSLQALSVVGGRPLPEADWQFVYTLYLNIFGIALMCFIIGYCAMLLLGQSTNKIKFENSMEATRTFMKRRKLPKELRQRVEQFYDYMWNKSEFSHLDEEKMLRHLPLSIKQEISFHGNFSALKQLPQLSNCDSSIVRSLVYKIKRRTYLPGQFVYRSGDAGTEMYIVGEGVLQIIRERDGNVSVAKAGDVFGEMNLLNLRKNYRRSADVVSCGYSELFVLTASDVHETLLQYPHVRNLIIQQAKREKAMIRRQMSSNFYKRHAQESTFTEGKSSEKFESSQFLPNIGSSSKENFTSRRTTQDTSQRRSNHSNSSYMPYRIREDTPDSGMPSSPHRRKLSETEIKISSGIPPGGVEMIMRPDIAEKLTAVYHNNLRSLQKSLDAVWSEEVNSLKQQLAETENERDNKAREVVQLRRRASKERKRQSTSMKGRTVTPTIAEEKTQENSKSEVSDIDEVPRKSSFASVTNPTKLGSTKALQSNVKDRPGTKSQRKRAFLPTSRVSLQSEKSEASTNSTIPTK